MTRGQRKSRRSTALQVSGVVQSFRRIIAKLRWLCVVVNYLRNYRLQWGQPDRLALLPSILNIPEEQSATVPVPHNGGLPPIPIDPPPYFKADMSPQLISVIMNDWPYSGTT